VIVNWCPAEGGCKGGFCERALKWSGHPTMALVKAVEPGRHPWDVVQLFTADLAKAAVPRATDGAKVLSPVTAEYEIHSNQDYRGLRYWTALYSGNVELSQLLDQQPVWDEGAAAYQAMVQLEELKLRRMMTDGPGRRAW